MKIDIVANKSKLFFTPVFNMVVPIQYFSRLANTYFWYDEFHDECFNLLYKWDGRITGKREHRRGFTVYEENTLFKHELFRGYADYDQFTLYQFDITETMLEIRDIIISGKYSEIPDVYKQVIVQFNTECYGVKTSDKIRQVLYKDRELIRELADKYGVDEDIVPEGMGELKPMQELFINSVIEREDGFTDLSTASQEDRRTIK